MGRTDDAELRLATGITTHCTRHGHPDGRPALLLLHSWGASRHEFGRLLPLLPEAHLAVAVDLRGHGDADRPSTGYGLAALAEDVVAVLAALDLPDAVLVGASSGGYLAQQVALDAPGHVAGLVLAGTPRDLGGRAPFAAEIDALTDPVDPAWVRGFLSTFTDLDRLPAAYVGQMVDDALRLPADTWRASLAGLCEAAPPTDRGRLLAPTLVVSGARDHRLAAQTPDLLAAVPGARWIEYPDTGHLVVAEQHERLAADVAAFLATLPS